MRDHTLPIVLALFLVASSATAAEEKGADARVLTGKERLGPKWSDEQRVDDCKVPPEKRTKERPADCTKAPSG